MKKEQGWYYKPSNKFITCLDDIPNKDEVVGFTYKIVFTLKGNYKDYFYIGRKILVNKSRTKIGVREKKLTKTRKIYKVTTKESNWLTYTGSCEELNNLISIHGVDNIKKEILQFATSKTELNYLETKYLFKEDVLETLNCFNRNIGGHWWKKV